MTNKKSFGIIEVIVIVLITGIVSGITTGLIILNKDNKINLDNNIALQEFVEAYSSIINNYYEEIDQEELINSAINGMFNYLGDDYTSYLSKEMTQQLQEKLAGEYEGIGVQITGNNIIFKVFENSPAEKAGIMVDDQIIKVNGIDVTEKTTEEVAEMIKTTKGKVEIILLRNEEEITLELSVEKINLPSVEYKIEEINNKKIGYIYISTFSQTTKKQVENALEKMEKEEIKGLVLDLRDNTGGYLISAKDIASLFLEKGKVIYYLEDKKGTTTYKDETAIKRTYPISVILNGGSASASEVLAGALKYSYGAQIVGETSFGKGKVQQTANLDNGSMIKYTSAKWLMPNKECIDNKGIAPDYEIKPDYSLQPTGQEEESEYLEKYEIFRNHINEINENQYNKALEITAK